MKLNKGNNDMTNKILDKVTKDTIPSKDDIESMWFDLLTTHSHNNGKDTETSLEVNSQAIEIMSMKLFIREACKQGGSLTRHPFNQTKTQTWDRFGQYIAEDLNSKIDDKIHMDGLKDKMELIKKQSK